LLRSQPHKLILGRLRRAGSTDDDRRRQQTKRAN
jgi:hypothetical protein